MHYKNMLSRMHNNKVPALGLQEQACMQYEGTRNSLQSTLNLSGLLRCLYLSKSYTKQSLAPSKELHFIQ
jgi:hypothetical protein